jgi:hypothetical protein
MVIGLMGCEAFSLIKVRMGGGVVVVRSVS